MEHSRLKSSQWVDARTHITLTQRTVDYLVKMHLHEFYELEIILDGCGTLNLNGTTYPLSKGSVYFLTPIDFHAVTPNTALEIANLSFDEPALSPQMQQFFMNRRDNFIFLADDAAAESLYTLFSLLSRECQTDDEFGARARKNLLELMLLNIARADRDSGIVPQDVAHMQNSLQYLFCHFREQITLSQVAAQSGYTPNYFSKLFRDFCGTCFVDFLCQLRLNYAKMLLLSTTLSTTEIAEKSGFGSASSFFRRFAQNCGCTPDSFRKNEGPYNAL